MSNTAYDIGIISQDAGTVEFSVRGKYADSGLLLLQRLYTLLFADQSAAYRGGVAGCDLLEFIDGGNTPPDQFMSSMLGIACSDALRALDTADRALVSSFTADCVDGVITCSLTLTDGTTVTGRI